MRSVLLTLCFVSLVGAGLSAQTTRSTTAPAGYESADGGADAYFLGRYADGDVHEAIGSLRGQLLILSEVAWRADRLRNYDASTGMGRRWTSVRLQVDNVDTSKFSATFSSNFSGSQTTVFNTAMSWPTLNGLVTKADSGQQVRMPFSQKWTYNGRGAANGGQDLLLAFSFRGGTLLNGGGFATGRSYYLDSIPSTSFSHSPLQTYLPDPFAPGACADSAHGTNSPGAYTTLSLTVFSEQHPQLDTRGTFRASLGSFFTAPNSPVVQVVSLGGSETGVGIGAACNPLRVSLPNAFLLQLQQTGGGPGASPITARQGLFDNAWAGVQLFAQSAWPDSRTGAFSLTATQVLLTSAKPQLLANRLQTFSTSAAATVGAVPSAETVRNSLPRFVFE